MYNLINNKKEKNRMSYGNNKLLVKRFQLLMMVLFTGLLLIASGCSKDESDDDNPVDPGNGGIGGTGSNTVTINGAGMTNRVLNFGLAQAAYLTDGNVTGMLFTGTSGSDSVYMAIYFSGQESGTFEWQQYDSEIATSGMAIRIGGLANDPQNVTFFMSTEGSGNTVVTSYGGIGQKIAGTFTGTLTETGTEATATVSGKFSVSRSGDE